MNRTLSLIAAAGFTVASGQTPAERLTLRDAIEIGLRPGHRADTALAGEAVARARSVAAASKASLLPLVESSVSGGERKQNLAAQGFGGGAGGSALPIPLNPSFTTFDARPAVKATLINLSQWKSWKASKSEIGKAAREKDWAMDGAALNIANAYLACLQARAEKDAAVANLRLSEDLLLAAEARLKAGTATVVDVTRAKSQAASDRGTLLAQEQAELEARASLFRAIGLEHSDIAELVPLPEGLLVESTFAAGVAAAEANRADLGIRMDAVRIAREKLKAVDWERFPTVSASFDIGRNGTSPANTAWTRNGTASVSVTLFDFGRRSERQSQAAIALREEQIRLEDLRREIARQVRVAIGKMNSARAQIEAAKAELELASLQIAQSNERLSAGLSTGLDVSDAQNRHARGTRTALRAEYSLQSAAVEYLNATGQLRQQFSTTQ